MWSQTEFVSGVQGYGKGDIHVWKGFCLLESYRRRLIRYHAVSCRHHIRCPPKSMSCPPFVPAWICFFLESNDLANQRCACAISTVMAVLISGRSAFSPAPIDRKPVLTLLTFSACWSTLLKLCARYWPADNKQVTES